jgi:hypothetical protein
LRWRPRSTLLGLKFSVFDALLSSVFDGEEMSATRKMRVQRTRPDLAPLLVLEMLKVVFLGFVVRLKLDLGS